MKRIVIFLLSLSCVSCLYARELSWRGVMIDVSRHFVPLQDLKRQVDAMAVGNLNMLHLHLTDAAGWRMEIKQFPRLTEVGAWRTHATWKEWWKGARAYGGEYGGFYTQKELGELVDYARERGITIVPEVEFPAHSEEAIAAYPFLGFNHAEMDMQKDSTYWFMERVLGEVARVFPGPYIHVGGDEAATQRDLQPRAMRRLQRIVTQLGRKMVVWDEGMFPSDTSLVVMAWRGMEYARRAAGMGHDVVLCPGRWMYLDKAQDSPLVEPEGSGGYLPIDSMYSLPVWQMEGTKERLLGIQCNLWTEFVPTIPHLERMLWPRALAVSRMAKGLKSDRKAHMAFARKLQDSLGINVFPLWQECGQRAQWSRKARSKAVGCVVKYVLPYYKGYAAGGSGALTDGLQGGWDNADGRWQGFINGGMDVVVDLGKMQRVREVNCHFLQSVGPEIFLPARVEVQGSTDGEVFSPLGSADIETETDAYCIRKVSIRFKKSNLRYIRFMARPGSRGGWLFADELLVN